MNTLIIAEKPSVALRIAIALGNNTQKRLVINGVSYYQIDTPDGSIYIVAAVGHLFTIRQKGTARGYPVLDIEWAPTYEVNKQSWYTKKYLDVINNVAPKCQLLINACDFDIEGTVIGTNIIKFIKKGALDGDTRRMKFSTTTIPDLQNAYGQLMQLDTNNFAAGEARHMLDWLWGINLSRALMQAVSAGGTRSIMSIGRVQGPALALLSERERAIGNFVAEPFWRITCMINQVKFTNARGDIFDKQAAEQALSSAKTSDKAIVEAIETKENVIRPAPPFDMTTLQLEASRIANIDPSKTLAIAQVLYERAYISYPRTSSQKLPPTLGLQRIIGEIAKNPDFEKLARALIEKKRFRPSEGAKTDEAHPAIYPTGVRPKELSSEEATLYEIIVRRFLACFADYAAMLRTSVTASIAQEKFHAEGKRLTEEGWLAFYPYAKSNDVELPQFENGQQLPYTSLEMEEHKTMPPKRYSKATLIAELERKNLGTKATRAAIIDTLFRRNYIEGRSIKVTSIGLNVYDVLKQNCPMIVDEVTTSNLEEDMEEVSQGKKQENDVIEQGKHLLLEALTLFDKNSKKIAESMQKSLRDVNVLGACPTDNGDLVIKRSAAGKQFVGCANYPKCTQTYPLPQFGKIVPTGKACEHCKTPIIKLIRGKMAFEMDLDPSCITKKNWKSNRQAQQTEQQAKQQIRQAKQPRQPRAEKTEKKRPAAKKRGKATSISKEIATKVKKAPNRPKTENQ